MLFRSSVPRIKPRALGIKKDYSLVDCQLWKFVKPLLRSSLKLQALGVQQPNTCACTSERKWRGPTLCPISFLSFSFFQALGRRPWGCSCLAFASDAAGNWSLEPVRQLRREVARVGVVAAGSCYRPQVQYADKQTKTNPLQDPSSTSPRLAAGPPKTEICQWLQRLPACLKFLPIPKQLGDKMGRKEQGWGAEKGDFLCQGWNEHRCKFFTR